MVDLGGEQRTVIGQYFFRVSALEDEVRSRRFGDVDVDVDTAGFLQWDYWCELGETICYHEGIGCRPSS